MSCWSLGEHDNMALWQLYGGVERSVAITSTIGELVQAAFDWQQTVLIRKVRYIDHSKEPAMVIADYTDLLQFKHEAYRYEEEVRIIVPRQADDWERNPDGLRLPLGDLNALVHSVIVSPEAKDWFYELVEDVTNRYGVSSPVRRSNITSLQRCPVTFRDRP